jgi:hypothetical protein
MMDESTKSEARHEFRASFEIAGCISGDDSKTTRLLSESREPASGFPLTDSVGA